VPFNSIITNADVAALNSEEVQRTFLRDIADTSAALQVFTRIPVGSGTVRLPVLAALPTAYWVDGPTGLKQTTKAAWADRSININELAALVPVPDATIEDADFDVLAAVRPLVATAANRLIDQAVFFGSTLPTGWTGPVGGVVGHAVAAGHVRARGTAAANAGGLAEDINQTMAFIEEDGFDPNFAVGARSIRARLRGARDTSGQKLLDVTNNSVEGIQISYAMPGGWPTGASAAELIFGDGTQGAIAVRRDLTFEVDNSAVIHDETGSVIFNAFQQDLTILRVTMRVGFVVANTLTLENPTTATRSPFAVLRSPA
jgi:HK97 family phage major capsid protein